MNDPDPWAFLKEHTVARIAQGRTGHSLPTAALLSFQLDHARARDAVYSSLNTVVLLDQLKYIHPQYLHLQSQATDRQTYLQRPDLGRKLDEVSRTLLRERNAPDRSGFDLGLVIADGLSATAINQNALPVVSGLIHEAILQGWTVAPVCMVEQGRVAIGDEIAHGLGARMLVVLIGERPGLSSPDSMGAYLTYSPRPGLTDESRNCVSNIRPDGLPGALAVEKIMYLLSEMKRRQLSGVKLKDDMPIRTSLHTSSPAAIGQTPETPD
ncbi:MAG: eutC [Spirosoma sp.]|nr:eutC [Spirosoma sp.]